MLPVDWWGHQSTTDKNHFILCEETKLAFEKPKIMGRIFSLVDFFQPILKQKQIYLFPCCQFLYLVP